MIIQSISPKKKAEWVLKTTLAQIPMNDLDELYRHNTAFVVIGLTRLNQVMIQVVQVRMSDYVSTVLNVPYTSFSQDSQMSGANSHDSTPPIPSGYIARYCTVEDLGDFAVVAKGGTEGIYIYRWE